jgi:hypothetical protein
MPVFIAISDYKICKPGTMHALAYSYETGVPKKTRLRKLLTQEEKNTLIQNGRNDRKQQNTLQKLLTTLDSFRSSVF